MDIAVFLEALKVGTSSHIEAIQEFYFSFYNPLFWLLILTLFLVLMRFWDTKKAFSFCFVIAVILLASTELEKRAIEYLMQHGEVSELFVIRMATLLLISVISLYYAFLKDI